jgi:ribosomal protein S18 acetylase RimI-like enzyme
MEAYLSVAFAPGQIVAELADETNTFLVATAAGTLNGYAKLRRATPDDSVTGPAPIEIERIYVDNSAIGTGLGAMLMEACLGEARTTGHAAVWLGVWERNARAIGFYERWGFRRVGEHAFLLGSSEQVDWIMERKLDQE